MSKRELKDFARAQQLRKLCIELGNGLSNEDAGKALNMSLDAVKCMLFSAREKRGITTYRLVAEEIDAHCETLHSSECDSTDLFEAIPDGLLEPLVRLVEGDEVKGIKTRRFTTPQTVHNQLQWLRQQTGALNTFHLVSQYVRAYGIPERESV
jgi:hypothetical protein